MIAIISDIHGNYPALKAVYEEIKKLRIDNIICLGDICGYYSQINECFKLVLSVTENIVLGNHDYYMMTNTSCPRSNSANKCLDYQRKIIKPEYITWLKTKPTNAVYFNINCVHGGWNNNIDEYVNKKSFENITVKERFLVSGHNHIPQIWKFEKFLYCNPGSVGQPRDGDNRASFAIYKNNSFEIKKVNYDYKETQNKMKECGFGKYYYENLEYGLPIGTKFHNENINK